MGDSLIMTTAQEKYLRLRKYHPRPSSEKINRLEESVEYTKALKADIEKARTKYKTSKANKVSVESKANNKTTKTVIKKEEDSKREESKKRLPRRRQEAKKDEDIGE